MENFNNLFYDIVIINKKITLAKIKLLCDNLMAIFTLSKIHSNRC